ncbi:MAG TPA: ABC transporter ATP-binding protein [Casimicrobiaceae bacterium]|nr:ABC transporter ATP-binding protein [Casimicrobiaceae bacterium]
MAELTVENLQLAYGDNPILKGVDMTLDRGEVVSLLGPSGSGKTTLLRAVAGLEAPSQGRVLVGDKVVFDASRGLDVPAEGRNLGLVFQSYALWPHKTVFDNVAYGLRLRNASREDVATRVQAALDQLSLGSLASRFPHQLSGGQQQRVALARALVYNPPVILLDEPLSNLDAKLREEARAWLRELIVRMQLSALCVTHDQAEAMAMSDRILLLNGGRIEQQGTPQEMYSAPQTLFTADFMGSNNRLTGRIAEVRNGSALLEGSGWRLWGTAKPGVASGADAVGMIRLERIRIVQAPGDNRLAATLSTSMYLGDRWEHLFHVGEARVRAYGDAPLEGETHWLEVPAQALWIF